MRPKSRPKWDAKSQTFTNGRYCYENRTDCIQNKHAERTEAQSYIYQFGKL